MPRVTAAPLHDEPGETGGLISRLLAFIAHHRLGTGDRLPAERDLATRFTVSRNALREAITTLEALRLVERRPNSGIYLRSARREGSLDALVLQADLGIPLSVEEARDIVEMRRILEIQAIRLACERGTAEDIARFDRILAESADSLRCGRNFASHDQDFHLALVEATGNTMFLRVVTTFYLCSRQRRQHYFADGLRAPASHAQHVTLRDALARRDAEQAVGLMDAHLQGVESYWTELIQKKAPPQQ
jgi:GntR family transcriptional repressor for pyruvate dehydrogenase complex